MVGIAGLGLIGASLGLALRRAGLEVRGCEPSPLERAEALRRGAVGATATDVEALARECDILFLCAPPAANLELLDALSRMKDLQAIHVSDTGSVKGAIAARGRALPAGSPIRFVPGHPMAGSERSGAAAARADLFEGAAWYLCGEAPAAILEPIQAAGARPIQCSVDEHDARMAALSHLPQALAWLTHSGWAARGWTGAHGGPVARELERLASSPAALWADILLENRGPVGEELTQLRARLVELGAALESGDRARLLAALGPDGA